MRIISTNYNYITNNINSFTFVFKTSCVAFNEFQKRLLIFPNGEAIESAQYVWGETVSQILYNSVMRLGLNKQPKYLFTLDGRLVRQYSFLFVAEFIILLINSCVENQPDVSAINE